MPEDRLEKDALEIARRHWLKGDSFKKIGEDYGAAASTVCRWVKRWGRDGRFDLVDRQASQPAARVLALDASLEAKLVKDTKVWQARVARISGVEAATNEKYRGDPNDQDTKLAYIAGDELHRALGEVGADFMLGRLRRGSTIGLASGRGVGFTIMKLDELAKENPARISGFDTVRLVSLCGGARVGTWAPSPSRDLDADENVFSLAAILKVPKGNLTYMGGWKSLVPNQALAQPEPPGGLDLALVGLGQINTRHDFLYHYGDFQLGDMAEPIRQIREWQSGHPELLCRVAEVGHRTFPVGETDGLPKEFLEAINEIGRAVWAMSSETIRQAKEVILVAGGAQKVNALFELLAGTCHEAPVEPNQIALITDSWTAEEILRRSRDQSTRNSP